jgi:hypothetical protein
MSYRDRWLSHLIAPLTGNGFNRDLARDFLARNENPWDETQKIEYRWARIVYAYAMSTLAQLTLPSTLTLLVLGAFYDIGARWTAVTVAGATVIGLLFALIVGSLEYMALCRRSRLNQ